VAVLLFFYYDFVSLGFSDKIFKEVIENMYIKIMYSMILFH